MSQIRETDSLLEVIKTTKNEQEKSISFTRLAKFYENKNIDSALYYGSKGYEIAKLNKYTIGIAESAAALADFYVINNQLEDAKMNYEIALENFHKNESTFDIAQISMIIGNINLAQSKYIEALELYQESLDLAIANNFNSITPHLYNNLGELYLELDDLDDAKENFEKAYSLFIDSNDKYNAAHPLANISKIRSKLGENKEAISGYLDVIRIFSVSENWEDIAVTYNAISEIYISLNEYQKADDYLKLALNTIDNQSGKFKGPVSFYKTRIYTTAAKLLFFQGNYNQSLDYARRSLRLAFLNNYKKNIFENAKIASMIFDRDKKLDSALKYYKVYIQYNEEYQHESDVKRITQLKMQYEFDKILRKKKIDEIQKQAEYKRKELIYLGISVFTVLGAVIMILLFVNLRNKTAKIVLKKENLELEKAKLKQDIDYKKKELASNMMYLIEKNEFITTIARKLIDMKPDAKKDNQEIIQRIINELKQNSSEKIWDEFEIRFKEVHSDFYNELHQAYPDLTPNEIKICAFLRLNMSTKEISAITHQSIKSINMARFRLRKKINIERDENLISFLTQF